MCRVLNGMWQVSGAHGAIDPAAALNDMIAYHQAGFTTWDLADHYGPAEDFIGAFRLRLAREVGQAALREHLAFTKWVPRPGHMARATVEQAVALSLRRMGVDALDMLQFHWWDYAHPAFLDALRHLHALHQQGVIRALALTNFDSERLRRICEMGIGIVSNQVQYSLIDRRPERAMADVCAMHDVKLLAYGSLCGGLLSERYLDRPEPTRAELQTASLRKYKQMIDTWGDWDLFQQLLHTCQRVAARHAVSIANVAVRFILDRPSIAGVIAGTRLGVSEHRAERARVFSFALEADDVAALDAASGKGRNLFTIIGDCGDEYRR